MAFPKWMFRDRSFGFKFAVAAVVPVIIVVMFFVYASINNLERQMIEKTRLQAKGLLGLSVLSVSNPFVCYNKELLDAFVDNLLKEETVVYAMVVDTNDNRILAHTNHLNDGKIYDPAEHRYGVDMEGLSVELLADRERGEIYDLSAPVIIRGVEYGVVKIGFSFRNVRHQIGVVKTRALTVGAFAVALGLLTTILLGQVLSRPINGLAAKARKIGEGNFDQKMDYDSKDALGGLALAFNEMAQRLKGNIAMLAENEAKYHALFEHSPISLWEEDLSEVKKYVDGLRAQGVTDLRKYFDDHPEEIGSCINRVKIVDVNRSSWKLYEAENKEAFLGNLRSIRTEKTHEILIDGVISLAEGKPVEIEVVYRTLTGKEISVLVNANIPPGYEETWEKAFVSIQDLTERHRAAFLEEMFGRYVSRKVVSKMLENPDSVKLGGEKRSVTIMMSDLRGFTALSERLEPEQVVEMLNTYLEVMVTTIREHGGTIIEIIGDALLVLFGAPQEIADRARQAVACAIEMQNAMTRVTAYNRERGFPEMEMGIALNDAEVVVGNIGSKKRSKYAVVGRGVNMTGRIEAYSVGGQILIFDSVRKEAGDILRIDNQMVVHPKGADAPITIYQVGGIGGQYNIALEEKTGRLHELNREIPVRYTVLEGKHVGERRFTGTIVRLSRKTGDIRLETPLKPLTNIRINLVGVGEELAGKDFYGKILESSQTDPNLLCVRFTALPPAIDGYIQAALDQAGVREEEIRP